MMLVSMNSGWGPLLAVTCPVNKNIIASNFSIGFRWQHSCGACIGSKETIPLALSICQLVPLPIAFSLPSQPGHVYIYIPRTLLTFLFGLLPTVLDIHMYVDISLIDPGLPRRNRGRSCLLRLPFLRFDLSSGHQDGWLWRGTQSLWRLGSVGSVWGVGVPKETPNRSSRQAVS